MLSFNSVFGWGKKHELKTFVKIVNGLVELEDDLLLLLEELPPDGHQVALLLHHPQPRPGDINCDLELKCYLIPLSFILISWSISKSLKSCWKTPNL